MLTHDFPAAHVLSVHPGTSKFKASTFVGSSNSSSKKKGLYELVDSKNQQATLEDLRSGRINLIVTTEALEEGIDVVSCNVVICFEMPKNVRSFVQRRGRARNPTSRYVLLCGESGGQDQTAKWRHFEDVMTEFFKDETRQLHDPDVEDEEDERFLYEKTTGFANLVNGEIHEAHAI